MDKKRQSCFCQYVQALISVPQAESLIHSSLETMNTESIPLAQAQGRYLREDIFADRDLPPFDRVMMDGIAIRFSSWQELNRAFAIEGIQAAGTAALSLKNSDHCIEVMTGCVLPEGCDCVVPIEQITITDQVAHIQVCASLRHGQHIHCQGSDTVEGTNLLQAGIQLQAPELSIAASCGMTTLQVSKLPRILIISTGDEVVEPHETPLPHQIRRSHSTALHASITGMKLGIVTDIHIADEQKTLQAAIEDSLLNFDIIVMTGGVSRGKYDYVAPILEQICGSPLFHGIAQRPGKPFAYWRQTGKQAGAASPPIFALPGNPVSVLACAARYLIPALYQMATGQKFTPSQLRASGSFKCPSHFTGLIPSEIINGKINLQPPSNSGNFLALAGTQGVAEIKGDLAGEALLNELVNFYPW
ncbi:MAG: molybdopterin molybdotransferase MoeA [Akkermansiaceae bacterium]